MFWSGIHLVPSHADGIITWEAFVRHLPAAATRPGTDFTRYWVWILDMVGNPEALLHLVSRRVDTEGVVL